MSIINEQTPMLSMMVKRGIFSDCPFTLIDVGCGGGIHSVWRGFEPSLRAYGLDPMIDEIAKLKESEDNPEVRYYPTYVGLPPDHPMVIKRQGGPSRGCDRMAETSASWASSLIDSQEFNHDEKRALNLWHECRLADPSNIIGLSEFVKANNIDNVDFIKIDIDSYDYDVLISSQEIMNKFPVLGFAMEVHFAGTDSELDNTFHNMDRFMRANGYDLFGLSVYQYSHKDLPGPFIYGTPGPTEYGPPLWGDAFYIRNLVSPLNVDLAKKISDGKLFKLAALFEIYSVPDCAAGVLNVFKERLSRVIPLKPLLNSLVPETTGRQLNYDEYISTFKNNIEKFFPFDNQETPLIKSEMYERLKHELNNLRRSRSWRITAPLRYAADIARRIRLGFGQN